MDAHPQKIVIEAAVRLIWGMETVRLEKKKLLRESKQKKKGHERLGLGKKK